MMYLGVCFLLSSLTHAWEEVNELRMFGELRVANEGLSNDGVYWYISNAHALFKTEKQPLKIISQARGIPDELHNMGFDHIGDIDVEISTGLLYGGIEGGNNENGKNAYLATYNTTDLSIVSYKEISQDGAPWVCIDPAQRNVFSSPWNEKRQINVYDMDTLEAKGVYTTPEGLELPGEIQGAAMYENELYLAVNGDCAVYKYNIYGTDDASMTLTLQFSGCTNKVFEMEGLSFWDLRQEKPHSMGLMHLYGNFDSFKEKGIHSYEP
jgi:hypothetical protein